MKKIIITTLLMLSALSVMAQTTLKSSYFMDRMVMRHKLNPALAPEYGYFAIPALGDVNVGISSNLSLDKFLYPLPNGNLGLFLHPDVDRAKAMAAFGDHNIINEQLNLTLLSTGFYAFKGYNTLDISIREEVNFDLNGSVFDFLLGGKPDATSVYALGGNTIDANAYAEVALGHSHKINKNLTIGVKVKYLSGLANARLDINKIDLTSSSDKLAIDAAASGDVAILGSTLEGKLSEMDFDALADNYSVENIGNIVSNLNAGFAFDFGATYKMDNFNFSAAVVDLGSIGWNGASRAKIEAGTDFEGFEDMDFEDFEGSTDGQLDRFEDDLNAVVEPEFMRQDAYRTSICPTMNIAAEYNFFGGKISTGLLSSTYFSSATVTDFMLAATFRPVKWFSVALTGTATTIGTKYWGWVVNFSPRWINFYIGSDSMFSNVNPQFVPIDSSNIHLNLGLSIPFGKVHPTN